MRAANEIARSWPEQVEECLPAFQLRNSSKAVSGRRGELVHRPIFPTSSPLTPASVLSHHILGILLGCPCPQMVGITAGRDITGVTDKQPIRDRPVHQFPCDPVCAKGFAAPPEFAIAFPLDTLRPDEAGCIQRPGLFPELPMKPDPKLLGSNLAEVGTLCRLTDRSVPVPSAEVHGAVAQCNDVLPVAPVSLADTCSRHVPIS